MRNSTEKAVIKEFLESPLFAGCDTSSLLGVITKNSVISSFPSGSLIMRHGKMVNSEASSPSILYIYKGKCLISSTSNADSVLRVSEEKELIGLAGVFLNKEIETKVTSFGGEKTVVLSLDIKGLNAIMDFDVTNSVRNNLFRMLANKISFLNEKISTLTGGSAEKKLAMFLLSFQKERFKISLSMSKLSSMLDIGRSSLYRALDSFESNGAIKKEGDVITILDKDYLQNK